MLLSVCTVATVRSVCTPENSQPVLSYTPCSNWPRGSMVFPSQASRPHRRRSTTVATINVLSSGLSTSYIAALTSYSVVVRCDGSLPLAFLFPLLSLHQVPSLQTRHVLLPCPCTSVIAATPHQLPGIVFRVEVRYDTYPLQASMLSGSILSTSRRVQ